MQPPPPFFFIFKNEPRNFPPIPSTNSLPHPSLGCYQIERTPIFFCSLLFVLDINYYLIQKVSDVRRQMKGQQHIHSKHFYFLYPLLSFQYINAQIHKNHARNILKSFPKPHVCTYLPNPCVFEGALFNCRSLMHHLDSFARQSSGDDGKRGNEEYVNVDV